MPEGARQMERVVLLAIIALLVVGSILMVLPFLRAILWAVVFAVTLWPFFEKLERVLRGRSGLAAIVPTLLLGLVFFVPLVYVGSMVVDRASQALDYAQELIGKGLGPAPAWLKTLPLMGDRLEEIWLDAGRYAPKLITAVKPHVGDLLGAIVSAGTGMARVILIAALSMIILFILLKQGRPIRIGLENMAVRVGGEKGRRLLLLAGSVMRSVVLAILAAASAQAVLAIFGLWIAGAPSPVFIGMLAGLLGLIPIGLSQFVLLPVAGWLIFWEGRTGWGIFLAIWSFAVIGNIDNVIRPMLISRGAKIPFLVVLLGVLGGLVSGGIIGLFVGATLLAVSYTMLKEWMAAPNGDSSVARPDTDDSGKTGPGSPGKVSGRDIELAKGKKT
jgi:predicted PurR-regulated permease PerM